MIAAGKHEGEVGSRVEGLGDTHSPQYIAWDKTLADAEYLEELVKNKLTSESAAPKKV